MARVNRASFKSSLGTGAAGTCLKAMTSYFQVQRTTPVSGSRSGLTPSQLTGTFLGTDLEETQLGFPVSSILELTFRNCVLHQQEGITDNHR